MRVKLNGKACFRLVYAIEKKECYHLWIGQITVTFPVEKFHPKASVSETSLCSSATQNTSMHSWLKVI